MGDVVDMTGRIVVADQHPLGDSAVANVDSKDRETLEKAWREAPDVARYFADRHGLDYDDAVICLVHSLLREADQAADRHPEAAFVWAFIGESIYGLTVDE